MKKLLLISFLLIGISTGFADIPAAYVDIGYGARPMGMGGAFTALAADAHSVFWNPAGLAFLRKNNFTAMYTKQLDLIPYALGAYAFPAERNYFGVAFITSGDDALRESTLIGSYAKPLRLPVLGVAALGINFRYRNSTFGANADGGENRSQGSANGFGFDLGFLKTVGKGTRLGLFLRDAVNSMTYNNTTRDVTYSESIPAALITGIAQRIHKKAILAVDLEKALYDDVADKIHIGSELSVLRFLVLRGGMYQNIKAEVNRNYSMGLGLRIMKKSFGAQFDFAYLVNDIANSPRISFSLLY
jgi:long-subunit fatty acid transport protein